MKRLFLILLLFSTYAGTPALATGGFAGVAEPIVRLYPNPATSFVNVDLGSALNKGYSLQVYSFLGRKMHEVTNISQRVTLSLSEYNRGVYIYQLRDRSGKLVETGKFQVSK
ncbi:MAG TPA: T9SS type A sorting domain-containing protein [Chitinophagaceae bacterium]|nr:T9SS type A sorting domain-containing protein [Chitinophagaceae bacterium]